MCVCVNLCSMFMECNIPKTEETNKNNGQVKMWGAKQKTRHAMESQTAEPVTSRKYKITNEFIKWFAIFQA